LGRDEKFGQIKRWTKIRSDTKLQSQGDMNWKPYDRVFRQDAQLVEELQARLGVK
jgi:hypothetical protein